ncbi:hypothetical protein PAMP_005360 [Pampus punctatissimus]
MAEKQGSQEMMMSLLVQSPFNLNNLRAERQPTRLEISRWRKWNIEQLKTLFHRSWRPNQS